MQSNKTFDVKMASSGGGTIAITIIPLSSVRSGAKRVATALRGLANQNGNL